jgi:hypothetical protein
MNGRTIRIRLMIATCALASTACQQSRSSERRTGANVPLFATLYMDDDGTCSATYPEEPVRAKVGDKVTYQVLNTCKDTEPNVSLVIGSDGDPFNNPPKTEYTIEKIKFGQRKKFQTLTVGTHAASGDGATKLYRFSLRFNGRIVDPRLEVDP